MKAKEATLRETPWKLCGIIRLPSSPFLSSRALFFSLLLLCPFRAAYNEIEIGVLLVPKNSLPEAVALTLRNGNMTFEKIGENKSEQVFLQSHMRGGKLCLKSANTRCIPLSKRMYHKEISFFTKHVKCSRNLKKSSISLTPTPYHKIVHLQIRGCMRLCIYHHDFRETPFSRSFSAVIDQCRPGNINNMFYSVSEEEIEEYLAEREAENDILKNTLSFPTVSINPLPGLGMAYRYSMDEKPLWKSSP